MKHSKEWHTCDRCGAEINGKIYLTAIKGFRTAPLISTRIEIDYNQYDLCPKCRKEFERFMRNEQIQNA